MFYNKYLKYKMKYYQLKYNDEVHPKQNGGSFITDEPIEESVNDTISYNPDDDSYTVNSINYKIRLYSHTPPLIIGGDKVDIQFSKCTYHSNTLSLPVLMRSDKSNFCVIQNNGSHKSYFMFYNEPIITNKYATMHIKKEGIQHNDSDDSDDKFTYNNESYDNTLLSLGSIDKNIINYIKFYKIFLTISRILILEVDIFKEENKPMYRSSLGTLCKNVNLYNECCIESIFTDLPYKEDLSVESIDDEEMHDKKVREFDIYKILIDIVLIPNMTKDIITDNLDYHQITNINTEYDQSKDIKGDQDYKLQTYKSSGNTYRHSDKSRETLCIKQKPPFLKVA